MKVNVFLERENKNQEVDVNSIPEIFEKLKINPQTVIITRNNELITEDESLNDKDEIKFLSVISGG